jgi:hypothetical protein
MSLKDVHVDPNKHPRTMNYIERRATILRMIMAAGHPDRLSQTTLAEHFGVSQPQIHEDYKAIKEDIVAHLGDDAEFITESVFRKAVSELQKEGKHMDAARVIKMWNDWLFDSGARKRAPEQVEVTHRVLEERLRKAYAKATNLKKFKEENK